MQKTIPVDDAVGMVLPHDITRIDKEGGFKGRAFKKGHIICEEDIPKLKDLGKENIFVLELGPDDIHENEAAGLLADALAGPGAEVEHPRLGLDRDGVEDRLGPVGAAALVLGRHGGEALGGGMARHVRAGRRGW